MLKTGLQQLTDSLSSGDAMLCQAALHRMQAVLQSLHGSNTADAELPGLENIINAVEKGTSKGVLCI